MLHRCVRILELISFNEQQYFVHCLFYILYTLHRSGGAVCCLYLVTWCSNFVSDRPFNEGILQGSGSPYKHAWLRCASETMWSRECLVQALDGNADDYQYFKAVQFVKKVKKGPLQETSPLLNDISGVPTWEKVSSFTLLMTCIQSLLV